MEDNNLERKPIRRAPSKPASKTYEARPKINTLSDSKRETPEYDSPTPMNNTKSSDTTSDSKSIPSYKGSFAANNTSKINLSRPVHSSKTLKRESLSRPSQLMIHNPSKTPMFSDSFVANRSSLGYNSHDMSDDLLYDRSIPMDEDDEEISRAIAASLAMQSPPKSPRKSPISMPRNDDVFDGFEYNEVLSRDHDSYSSPIRGYSPRTRSALRSPIFGRAADSTSLRSGSSKKRLLDVVRQINDGYKEMLSLIADQIGEPDLESDIRINQDIELELSSIEDIRKSIVELVAQNQELSYIPPPNIGVVLPKPSARPSSPGKLPIISPTRMSSPPRSRSPTRMSSPKRSNLNTTNSIDTERSKLIRLMIHLPDGKMEIRDFDLSESVENILNEYSKKTRSRLLIDNRSDVPISKINTIKDLISSGQDELWLIDRVSRMKSNV